MRIAGDLEVNYAQIDRPEAEPKLGLFDKLERRKLLIIMVAVALGFCARAYRLDAAGFAEDEANKIFAGRAYERGDFTANAEHPMVMKMFCYASTRVASAWNSAAGKGLGLEISEEIALRLPNAAFGALTVIPLFLLTTGLLGIRAGIITSLLWALGLDAIWFNRTVKEDTLLVCFMKLIGRDRGILNSGMGGRGVLAGYDLLDRVNRFTLRFEVSPAEHFTDQTRRHQLHTGQYQHRREEHQRSVFLE